MDIKSVLDAYGFTTYSLAEKMGVSQPSVYSMVNGNPTAKKIEALAKAIGCSPAEFFADWKKDDAEEKSAEISPQGRDDMGAKAAELLPFSAEHPTQEGKSAPGMFICPHCGKGVSIRVEEI